MLMMDGRRDNNENRGGSIRQWNSTNHILKLNRTLDELEGILAKKRGEMAYMNQETGWYDNTGSLYPTYTEPNLYSIQLYYSDYWS
jgi:hypothetical protein